MSVCVVGKMGKVSSARREEEVLEGSQTELRPNGDPAPCQNELRSRTSSLIPASEPIELLIG